jgi:hypothetical protein
MFKSISTPAPTRILAAMLSLAVLGTAAAPALAAPQYKLKKAIIKGQTVYCHDERTTGSLTRSRTCHTKEEWAALGLVTVGEKQQAKRDGAADANGGQS